MTALISKLNEMTDRETDQQAKDSPSTRGQGEGNQQAKDSPLANDRGERSQQSGLADPTWPEADSLRDQFLIALPNLVGDFFASTVTYLVDHSDRGAFGFVINRPMPMTLAQLFEDKHIKDLEKCRVAVIEGGPVHSNTVFFLHDASHQYDSTYQISDELCLTTSIDIVHSLAEGDGPERVLTMLGYAGWDAGQLEREIGANVWLLSPAPKNIMFEVPYEERSRSAAALLGVDLNLIATNAGHG